MRCFVICPFGEADSETRKRSNYVFRNVIKPVTEAEGYRTYRSVDNPMPGNITWQVIRDLYEADLVIADLTDSNSNVFYELALRHSVEKPFILLSDDVSRIPFDVKTLNVIQVERVLDLERGDAVRNEIREQIRRIRKGEANFETDASRLHPARKAAETSVKVYTWEIKYTERLARDWLALQEEGLQRCVDNFMREDKAPCEPIYRTGLAEYMAYKLSQGLRLFGELYYTIKNENNTFLGWGNFTLPGSVDALAIRIDGDEWKEDKKDKIKINFSQPSRKIELAMGVQEQIRAFNYSITFEKDPVTPAKYLGNLLHPEFDGVLVGNSVLTLSYRGNST